MLHNGKNKLRSDSFLVYGLLALSGGCMDAYSYLWRDKVFANAQTGNMLLFGVSLANRDWTEAFHYFLPVLAFALGIMLSDGIRGRVEQQRLNWRQRAILLEALILFGVGFMPHTLNVPANALISFACGLQVESFRSLKGNAIATTMCIGNLRSATYHLDMFFQTKDPQSRKKSLLYFSVIGLFVVGAIAESFLLDVLEEKAIMLSVVLLLSALAVMTSAGADEPE